MDVQRLKHGNLSRAKLFLFSGWLRPPEPVPEQISAAFDDRRQGQHRQGGQDRRRRAEPVLRHGRQGVQLDQRISQMSTGQNSTVVVFRFKCLLETR